MDGTLWLGFAFALAAAFCYETGYAIQALEARRAPESRSLRPSLLGYLLKRPDLAGGDGPLARRLAAADPRPLARAR